MIIVKEPSETWRAGYQAGCSGEPRKAPEGLTFQQESEWYDGYDCGSYSRRHILCIGRVV